ncbi:unnamed protein product [Mytilus coruscus]|uniref:Uncharacterized protein n=1 Tax=Mytilus coruscus TaxID=42192 RepID=A0A6J8CH64_MYTCO|nr:unnamed protein product [Mytilus coruscus]
MDSPKRSVPINLGVFDVSHSSTQGAITIYENLQRITKGIGLTDGEGIGLTDGEGIERQWSYLGFANISKEMPPENRSDLSTDALIHYGRNDNANGGKCQGCLEEILTYVPELKIQDDTATKWIEEEKGVVVSSNKSDCTMHLNKADEYVLHLQRYYKISVQQSNGENKDWKSN